MFVVIIIFLVDVGQCLDRWPRNDRDGRIMFDTSCTFSCMRWVRYGATVQMHSNKLSQCQKVIGS